MGVEVLHPDATVAQGPFFAGWHLSVDEPIATPDGNAIIQAAGDSNFGQCGFPSPVAAAEDITGFRVRLRVRVTTAGSAGIGGFLENGAVVLGTWGTGDNPVTSTSYVTRSIDVTGSGPYAAVNDLRLSVAGTVVNTADYAIDVLELLVLTGEGDLYLLLPSLQYHPNVHTKSVEIYPY